MTSEFARNSAALIKRFRFVVFAFWAALALAGAKWGLLFTSVTVAQYDSPDGSDSAVASAKINKHFPSQSGTNQVTILLKKKNAAPETSIVELPGMKQVQLSLYNATRDEYGYDITEPCDDCFFRSMQSYWLLSDTFNATMLARSFVSTGDEEGESTLVVVTYDTGHTTDKIDDLIDFLDKRVKGFLEDFGLSDHVSHGLTGIQPFADAILEGIAEDLEIMDTAVLPLALLVLASIVQSLPFLLMPIINIICTILSSFLIMYPVALNMDVVSFTPSVMMSLTIAMSIDYSLFLLSRIMEETNEGRTLDEAIPSMLDNAGHTILVSGGTLVCCFLGNLFFPLAMLQSVGIGASTALLMALSVNLTLTPAVLYSIGPQLMACQDWLNRMTNRALVNIGCRTSADDLHDQAVFGVAAGNGTANGSAINSGGGGGGGDGDGLNASLLDTQSSQQPSEPRDNIGVIKSSHANGNGADLADSKLLHDGIDYFMPLDADAAGEDVGMRDSCWYKMTWQLLSPWKGLAVLVVVLALCTPVCIQCFNQDISISFELTVPYDSDTYHTFNHVEDDFGAGAVFPYKLLFVPTSDDICAEDAGDDAATLSCASLSSVGSCGLFCQTGFDQMNKVLDDLSSIEAAGYSATGVTTMAGLDRYITFDDYVSAAKHSAQGTATSFDSSIELLYESSCQTNLKDDGDDEKVLCESTVYQINLDIDPFDQDGVEWLKKARDVLDKYEKDSSVQFKMYLANGAGITYDAEEAVYGAFPAIIGCTMAVVFCLMGFAFGSIVAPLRSVATLCLTLSFVFGLLVLVYQDGAFDFMGMRAMSKVGTVCWFPPVMCFSIIVGLGLDYDVFLISRVFEYRLEGYTDHAAALKGVYMTGYIITAAGVIMAIAFGGLMASTETILNQVSFLLVFSVLMDTFVVRTLCVPALLGLTDSYSWFPKIMPAATRSIGF